MEVALKYVVFTYIYVDSCFANHFPDNERLEILPQLQPVVIQTMLTLLKELGTMIGPTLSTFQGRNV